MKRNKRTYILVEGAKELRAALAKEAEEKLSIINVTGPSRGLVMVKMRDSARKEVFFLGEVMVTEAKVRIGDMFGLGLIRGDDFSAARELAIVDAVFNSESSLAKTWIEKLEKEELCIREKREEEAAKLLGTRVEFSTMETF